MALLQHNQFDIDPMVQGVIHPSNTRTKDLFKTVQTARESFLKSAQKSFNDNQLWGKAKASMKGKMHGFHGHDPKGDNADAYVYNRVYTMKVGQDLKPDDGVPLQLFTTYLVANG